METFMNFCIRVKTLTARAASVLMAAVAFALLLQVVCRTLFNFSFSWEEEFARYAMIWLALLMASVLVHDKDLIAVDFLDHFWPKKAKKYRDLIIRIMFCVLFIFMTVEGFAQAYYAMRQTTIAMEISWFWPYLAIPVGSMLMLLQMAFTAVLDFASSKESKGTSSKAEDVGLIT